MYVVKQKIIVFLIPYVFSRALILVLAVIIQISFLFAQDSQYKEYNHTGKPQNTEGKLQDIVAENIDRAFGKINDYVEDHGNDLSRIPKESGTGVKRYGHDSPDVHPVDKMPKPEQQGRLDETRSWNEYTADSRVILNDQTFPQCLEPRLIAEKKNGSVTIHDPLNAAYAAACAANCPQLLFVANRNWQVVSYYWPEYQMSVNKAGSQMIDPDIVNENRGRQELYRLPTSFSEDTSQQRGQRQRQYQIVNQMGITSSKFKNPTWHRAPGEFFLRQDRELRYPSAMRPNAFWRAANNRRAFFAGYRFNETCLFNALDLPTGQKKVIANRYDQGIYALLARYPEIRKRTDPERYRYTSSEATNLNQYKNNSSSTTQFRENLCASWRMGTNQRVYGDLEKVGFQSVNDKKYLDYCLPGGYSLSGSMVYPSNTPRLQADAARVVMAAIYFSNDSLNQISNMNRGGKRLSKFTLYSERKNSSVNRYVNFETNPGENESKIVWLDKLQRIYPTQPLSDADGKGGESSAGARLGMAERGSHCFRPEDIPNWSSEGKTNKSEWPLGLALASKDHFGETRWAIWNRRIVCSCEDFGWAGGCLNLNDGDQDEDKFAGTLGFTGQKMPPAFDKAIPKVRGLADQKSPPSGNPTAFNGFDLSSLGGDSKVAGSTMPIMPPREGPPPEVSDPFQDLLNLFMCIITEDPENEQDQEESNDNSEEESAEEGASGEANNENPADKPNPNPNPNPNPQPNPFPLFPNPNPTCTTTASGQVV
jgi:hypothetical protein